MPGETGADQAEPAERPGFLDRLQPEVATMFRATGRVRRFPSPSILFHAEDDAHDVFVIIGGSVKVSVTLADHEVVLDVLEPGELLGELSAIEGRRRTATASALTEVEAVSIPTRTFIDFLAEHPDASLALLQTVAERLREASSRQVEYGALDAIGRLCRRLAEMMDRYGRVDGDSVVIESQLTQSDIAAWAGLSREAVVKSLRSLRTLGWIRSEGRTITVVDQRAVRIRGEIELA